MWQKALPPESWNEADAVFRDKWIQNVSMPEKWLMDEENIKFWVKLSPFKHTGVFPEQTEQWNWISKSISKACSQTVNQSLNKSINVLNMFAYTGIASLFAS